MTDSEAHLLRENTRTTGLEQTARAVAETLEHFDVPHLIVGGFAVQEHGYPRLTVDVDVVVPDVLDAVELLTASLTGPFQRIPGVEDRLVDGRNEVNVDLLPAGKVVKRGCRVPFPQPVEVTDSPKIVRIEQLISLKLDSWHNSPLRRAQDKADVIQLIIHRHLPRDLTVEPVILQLYSEIWDGLEAER